MLLQFHATAKRCLKRLNKTTMAEGNFKLNEIRSYSLFIIGVQCTMYIHKLNRNQCVFT